MTAFIDILLSHPPDPDTPLISIVIPVQNPDEKIFSECLHSIMAQELLPYCEVIVIDSSTRPVQTYDSFKELLRIYPLTRKNLSGARQDALDHVRGEVIVGIDCDCITEPGWLRAIITPLDLEKGITATVGHNLPAGKTWVSNWFQEAYEDWLLFVSAEIDEARYMFTIDMKNYAVYTRTAQEIGYDENMIAAEDHDFATRLRRHGHRIVYAPGAKLRHHHRKTLPSFLKQQGWHGFGYGQCVAKNEVDIFGRRPFRDLARQMVFLCVFPLFILNILRESRSDTWTGLKSYLVKWLVDCRFLLGILQGMHHQCGWPYLWKRFMSDLFSHFPGSRMEHL